VPAPDRVAPRGRNKPALVLSLPSETRYLGLVREVTKKLAEVAGFAEPVAERPKEFYLGHREYDPEKLGYKYDPLPNGFEFDTSIRGNWNTGHEFRKEYSKDKEIKGVIGPALSRDDRKAIIEYLKTL